MAELPTIREPSIDRTDAGKDTVAVIGLPLHEQGIDLAYRRPVAASQEPGLIGKLWNRTKDNWYDIGHGHATLQQYGESALDVAVVGAAAVGAVYGGWLAYPYLIEGGSTVLEAAGGTVVTGAGAAGIVSGEGIAPKIESSLETMTREIAEVTAEGVETWAPLSEGLTVEAENSIEPMSYRFLETIAQSGKTLAQGLEEVSRALGTKVSTIERMGFESAEADLARAEQISRTPAAYYREAQNLHNLSGKVDDPDFQRGYNRVEAVVLKYAKMLELTPHGYAQ